MYFKFYTIFILTLLLNLSANAQNDYYSGLYKTQVDSIKIIHDYSFKINLIPDSQFNILDAVNLDETINFQPGLNIRKNIYNESVVNLRGFEQRQVAVLLDGIPISVPYNGIIDLNQLPIEEAKEIRILKSDPSEIPGSNALGGAINILTAEPDSGNKTNVRLDGSNNYFSGRFVNKGIINRLYWMISGTNYYSDGYHLPENSTSFLMPFGFEPTKYQGRGIRNNSYYKEYGWFAKLGYIINRKSKISFSYLGESNAKGIPNSIYPAPPRYWRFSDWKTNLFNLSHEISINKDLNLKSTLFLNHYSNIFDSYDDTTYTTQNRKYAYQSTSDDKTIGIKLAAVAFDNIFQFLRAFILYKHDSHQGQTKINEPLRKLDANTFIFGAEDNYSILENLNLIAGVNFNLLSPIKTDTSDIRSSFNYFNAYLGTSWQLFDIFKMHLNLSKNHRFPTLQEIFSDVPGGSFNPGIKPEESLNIEAGLAFDLNDETNINLNFFNYNISNLIEVKENLEAYKFFVNTGKALINGIELSINQKMEDLSIKMNYTFLYARNESDSAKGQYLDYRPAHSANIITNYNFPFGLMWQTEVKLCFERYYFRVDSWQRMGDYYLFNMKLSQNIYKGLQLIGRVNNIFDAGYESEYGYPQPGRSIIIGLKADF